MAAPHLLPLGTCKIALRQRSLALLEACDGRQGRTAGRLIADRIACSAGMVVAGFYPKGHEIDITELLLLLRDAGCIVALPRTPARGKALSFHRWSGDDALQQERFGTTTSCGPEVRPDLLLVPLLAFDRRGHRLGYGGGYYDRTLAALPGVRSIGCAYAVQEVAEVPIGPHDRPLDAIATEREYIVATA